MAKKLFGKAEQAEVRKWAEERLKAGDSIREIRRGAREKFGAFEWSQIIALILEIVRKWLDKK